MKQHLHKARWKALLLGLSLAVPGWAQAQSQAPSPALALQLGGAQLSATLEWLDPAHLDAFGFDAKDDLSAIRLGTPVYRGTFTDDALLSGEGPVVQTDMVLLPLELNGTVRSFLYLVPAEDGRDWTVAGIGGANEARSWSNLLTAPETRDLGRVDMLHFLQNNADYLLLGDPAGQQRYQDISVSFSEKQGSYLSLDEVYRQAVELARNARATIKDGMGG